MGHKNNCENHPCEEKRIDGIVCDAKHCMYHDMSNNCCAGKIAVGPASAQSSGETVCATFKPREE